MPFLDWVNKNQAKETSRDVPYHLLHQEQTYGDAADNLLIQGDNLLALKALIPFYAGQVKCIFIDPPYNTQSAFEHYDDKLEHSQWLSMMYPRLVLLRELLAEDGSIWVAIDEREGHYLKVLMDEVFGRKSFIATIIWENFYGRSNAAAISPAHNYILCYSPKGEDWKHVRNLLPRSETSASKYSNPDNDPRGPWRLGPIFAAEERHDGLMYTITTPSGRSVAPPKGSHWRMLEVDFWAMVADNRIAFGEKGDNIPAIKLFLREVQDGLVPRSIWPHGEAGHSQDAKREVMALFPGQTPFGTPKPELLISNIIRVASSNDDLVLDSFLGSGTTAAVAHKMGRRWIGIEMGDHARTHCIPRLQKVIDGEQGGISEAVGWKGGGGFRFYTLGETAFDAHGHINAAVRFATLAAYVWHLEVGEPGTQIFDSPLLGIHNGTAYYLLYNGILGDRRPDGGNVLIQPVLQHLHTLAAHSGPKVIYGESSRLGPARLAAEGITFKQIPYDIKMR
ncbi:site-specific DNA-methyltransferase [Thiomonas delicata]|uniref:site-specific DNA-methyltransferase (adenine-specific) n=1 Tax=Thiomonas delicata TaxID=364030 RepID=A0A238D6V6_THIDL|nr:site-specific DNA-methyltransferase [Thiomonas delicata]SBP88951.1 DNA methylase N-4/N-6 domain protein [Thiomonas delicata]